MASLFDRFRLRPNPASAPANLSVDLPPDHPDDLPLDLNPVDFIDVWNAASAESDASDASDGGNPLIDVRRPDEFAQAHLAEAVLVDVTAPDFQGRIRALSLDPEAPVYLYCRTGNRSGHAARILRDMGIRKAVNVGGLDELVAAGGTLARDRGGSP